MGWASGSVIFSQIIKSVQKHVDDKEARKEIYRPIFHQFEADDWDTQDECMGKDEAYDELIKEIHPGWFEDED